MAETPRLRRSLLPGGAPAAPVRLVHLGLGSFFRAHEASYTGDAPDADEWGYAAFTGRRPGVVVDLAAQDGLYTLVERGSDGDRFAVVAALSEVHPAADHDAWLRLLAAPSSAAVTITVTEAGYHRGVDGRLSQHDPAVAADLLALRAGKPVGTAPARLVAGLDARRRADAGPLAVVPCDNLAANGTAVAQLVQELAERIDADLAAWMERTVSFVSTVVDRITPATTAADRATTAAAMGYVDTSPVVAEPFREWVLAGSFPAGRPAWERAGARFVDDATPFEHRKLWLLNGAHSLLAYAGPLRGHATVAAAFADDACRAWVEHWWDEAGPHLPLPADQVAGYRAALAERFANRRIEHRLAQIAADGSEKLPVRVLPVLRAERAAGRLPLAAARTLAAWLCHLRGLGVPVVDPRDDELVRLAAARSIDAVKQVLETLDPALGGDAALVALVADQADELARTRTRQTGSR